MARRRRSRARTQKPEWQRHSGDEDAVPGAICDRHFGCDVVRGPTRPMGPGGGRAEPRHGMGVGGAAGRVRAGLGSRRCAARGSAARRGDGGPSPARSGRPTRILLAHRRVPAAGLLNAFASRLRPGSVLAVVLGGWAGMRPSAGAGPAGRWRRCAPSLRRLAAASVARRLRASGLRVERLDTGDRSRRHPLGVGGPLSASRSGARAPS